MLLALCSDDSDPPDKKYWRYINWQRDLLNKIASDGTLVFPEVNNSSATP